MGAAVVDRRPSAFGRFVRCAKPDNAGALENAGVDPSMRAVHANRSHRSRVIDIMLYGKHDVVYQEIAVYEAP